MEEKKLTDKKVLSKFHKDILVDKILKDLGKRFMSTAVCNAIRLIRALYYENDDMLSELYHKIFVLGER